MAVANWGTKEPNKEVQDRVEQCIAEIYEACQLFFMFGDKMENEPVEVAETRFYGLMRHLFMRGSANFEHATQLLLAIFEPHDEFYRRNGFLTAREFVGLCDDIEMGVEGHARETLRALALFAALRTDFEERLRANPELSEEDALAQIRDSPAAKVAEAAMAKAQSIDPFLVPVSDANRTFVQRISLAPGDNAEFLNFEKSPAWPTNNTEAQTRPLVSMGGAFYCPNPVFLLRQRAVVLEQLIRETDPQYYEKRFSDVRGDVAEHLAVAHFRRLLPQAEFYLNAYYTIEEDGQAKRCECDGLIVFQDRLFILEVKAGSFSTAAMRGAPRSLKEDIAHLVGEPYRQARRTLNYLDNRSPARFEQEDGTLLVSLDGKAFRRRYIVNVTLADLVHVAARLNSVEAMGLIDRGVWPWSVYVNDLRVISELVESPAEFLLYLHRRLALNDQPAVSTVDELDYLGMFFQHGLHFEKDELRGVKRLAIGSGGFTVAIDRYYDRLAGRVATGEKPRLNISEWYRRFCRLVEDSRLSNACHVAETLLSIEGETQEKIERFARDYGADTSRTGKEHTMTLLSKDRLATLVFCVCAGSLSNEIADHQSYCEMKRAQVGNPELIFVAFDGAEPENVEFRIYDGPEIDGQLAQRAARDFQRTRYAAYVARYGKPGRNDSCPCNSGKKAKKCCLV